MIFNLKKVCLALLFIVSVILPVNAQTLPINDIPATELQDVQKRAKFKVDQFNNYLSAIASKETELLVKDAYIKEALKLFIGGGHDFKDNYGNLIKAPKMETSSINRSTGKIRKNRRPISDYLNACKNYSYSKVEVTASDAYYISQMQPVPGRPDTYRATMSYSQNFIGIRDGKVVYRDRTDKTIEIEMNRAVIDNNVRWTILLGNIYVTATE